MIPMLRRDEVGAEKERLRVPARARPDADRAAFHRDAARAPRDPDTHAVLDWFFRVGLHHCPLE